MNKKTIFFTIEHIERELYSKTFLAEEAAKNGFRCYIGSSSAIQQCLKEVGPSIVFHKSTWTAKAHEIASLGHKLVFLDEEAGFAIPRTYLKEFVKWRYSTIPFEPYYQIFTLNEKYAEYIKEIYGNHINAIATGWPRIDLWRNKNFQNIINHKNTSIRDKSNILFISSFGCINENEYQRRLDRSPDEIRRMVVKNKWKSFNEHLKLFDDISKIIPNGDKIILRPHPSESIEEWKSIIINKNLVLDTSLDVSESLSKAKVLINPGSTVAVQAGLLGIPSISYKPPTEEGVGDTVIYEVSETVYSAQELCDKIIQLDSMNEEDLIHQTISRVSNQICSLEGELAVTKIINSLKKLPISLSKPVKFSITKKLKIKIRQIKNNVYRRYNFDLNKKDKLRGGISVEKIKIASDKLNNFKKTDLDISQVFKDLVKIELYN